MTLDEVRMMDNRKSLLFIRGERPAMDLKYDIMKNPNISFSADGKAEPYVHGETVDAKETIEVIWSRKNDKGEKREPQESGFVLLTEEEIEKELRNTEGEGNGEQNQE